MKRDALLDAAEAVLGEHGSQALTLNAVAERAAVSKGGLLYHFPTKEALIQALVARVIAEFDDLVAEYAERDGSYTRGFVEASFAILAAPSGERTTRRWAAVTAAACSADQRTPLTEAMRRWHHRDPADEPDPVTASVVRLAAEGLWEVSAQDPGGYSAEQYAALRRRMLDLL
ncbi:TetR/AcrR family transcriptional regulator [Actinocorallia sp. A-T 12471]|uniref:TetR/AcrR family transcriptional regulator n=1 Tax=Actinocorallia sp. A-T 12471 TaxID=3089813 RepID=UPI0029CB1985|nr:TetR/AcrR family transcriptional regulator [Actinocorallia sp. A-T 12471]MDX6738997.1 TetR/AcrR family transcriptional regulator [Actinocorallia sp. A-T 12471]